jgi:hypothetical protein
VRYSRKNGWSAGREYAVHGYRTPWGALWGTWRLRWMVAVRHRLSVYFEPADLWVGIYRGPRAVYVCLLPCLVIRIRRQQS